MKKLGIALITCLALIGCGSSKVTTSITETLNISGATMAASYVQQFDVQNLTSVSQTVTDISTAVINNTGGAGTLTLANVPYQTVCPTVVPASPLISINLLAATNIPLTSSGAATAAAFNGFINSNYTLCAYMTQANTAVPVNFSLQIKPTITMTFSY